MTHGGKFKVYKDPPISGKLKGAVKGGILYGEQQSLGEMRLKRGLIVGPEDQKRKRTAFVSPSPQAERGSRGEVDGTLTPPHFAERGASFELTPNSFPLFVVGACLVDNQ